MGEAQEREALRFAKPAPSAPVRRVAAELDQAGFVRMERQRKLIQPFTHRLQEAPGVILMLEADDDVVGIAHDDHVARGLTPSPAFGPEIADVVQVDVGEQWRDRRSLPGSPAAVRHHPVFQDARLEPLLDQADDARVADPVLDEANQPISTDLIEERSDVGVQYEVHFLAGDPNRERVERVMRAASGPESVREPEEVFLVDRIQHCRRRSLDDLVFESGDRERALSPVRLRYVCPPVWQRPVRSSVESRVQVLEVAPEGCLVLRPCQPIHAGGGVLFEFVEGVLKPVDGEMVEERSELLLPPLPCGLPYAIQRLCHASPVLRPARALLARIPFGPRPWLHRLRPGSLRFVRRLPSYYGGA